MAENEPVLVATKDENENFSINHLSDKLISLDTNEENFIDDKVLNTKKPQKENLDWRKEINNKELFSQTITYNYFKLMEYLEKTNQDLENLNPLLFLLAVHEFTKALNVLSAALKYAFADITEKVEICRDIVINFYPNSQYIQEIMLNEIAENLHNLNGDNNSNYGHKKKTKYYSYQAMTRTILRILWFLRYIHQMFRLIQTTNDKLNTIMIKTYDIILAPNHGWLLRKTAHVGFKFAPDDRKPLLEGFFGNIIYIFLMMYVLKTEFFLITVYF